MRLVFFVLLAVLLSACARDQDIKAVLPVMHRDTVNSSMDAYINQPISVTIQKGLVNFHNINGFSAYQPVAFSLKNGSIITKALTRTGNNFFDSNAKITLYYHNGVLFVDYNQNLNAGLAYTAIQFTLNKHWLNGEVYTNVNSYGYSNLRDAEVTVRVDQ